MNIIFSLVLLVAITLISQQAFAASNITGTVTSVIDGDTIKIGDKKIRFMIVDAPEVGTGSISTDAINFVKQHCYNKNAFVNVNDPRPKDTYGRYLGLVFCNNETDSISEQLLIEDYGILLRQYNCDSSNEFINEPWVKC